MDLAQTTAQLLVGAQEELKNVQWKEGEANLDTGYSRLACSLAQNAWATMQQHDPELHEIEMVATPPDINCAFSMTNATTAERTHIASHKIELKSSETYTVPGSCIGKLNINQCIIFCKRPTRNGECAYEFAWGQYHQSFEFTDHDRLQDRTPRPNVHFKQLCSPTQSQSYQPKPDLDWVSHYSQAAINRLQQLPDSKKTWQEKLVGQIIDFATPPNPRIVSIDGNIGSGKSTTWHMLKEAYKSRDDVHFVEEPVDSWHTIVDERGVPILTNFYKDKRAYAFRFQMMAYISRLALLRRTVRENAGRCRVIITERSVETDRNIFAKMLYDSGDIAQDEYTIYNMWFHEFVGDMPVAGVVYIRADPDTCMERINKRGREGETIPLEYIQKCHDSHDEWINADLTCKKLVIDANPEIVSDAADAANDRIAKIMRFIDEL
jgi:deoxycitidine kinase/deoxyguanosine kinase